MPVPWYLEKHIFVLREGSRTASGRAKSVPGVTDQEAEGSQKVREFAASL